MAGRNKLGTRGKPEETRAAILQAALQEFAEAGLAGARTDAIARAAGVNKALLYYYFADKERLYAEALDSVFAELSSALVRALELNASPRQVILRYAAAHFDYMARSPLLPRLVHRELMQAGRHASPHVKRLAQHYLWPVFDRLERVLKLGMARGEFRPVDPRQFAVSAVGVLVHYFASAALVEAMMGSDPLAPASLRARRHAALDFIAAALFAPAEQSKHRPWPVEFAALTGGAAVHPAGLNGRLARARRAGSTGVPRGHDGKNGAGNRSQHAGHSSRALAPKKGKRR